MPKDTKLSKLDTLKLASSYIEYLQELIKLSEKPDAETTQKLERLLRSAFEHVAEESLTESPASISSKSTTTCEAHAPPGEVCGPPLGSTTTCPYRDAYRGVTQWTHADRQQNVSTGQSQGQTQTQRCFDIDSMDGIVECIPPAKHTIHEVNDAMVPTPFNFVSYLVNI